MTTLLHAREPPLPDPGTIAAGLHLSERILTRRLGEEGASYRQLNSEVLKHWAHQNLLYTENSVEFSATSPGYQDAAKFRRAFRSWENCPPNEFRCRAAKSDSSG
jgi:AraC-like DNA-binding protein